MTVGPRDLISNKQRKLSECFLICLPFKLDSKVFLMLAKARKSSFNANIGEFCSVTFVCLFVLFCFFMAP